MKRMVLAFFGTFLMVQIGNSQANFTSGETGQKVLGSYFQSSIDSVSIKNGNLHVEIPLFSLPGRELPLSVGVAYDHRFIEQWTTYDEFGVPTQHNESYAWRKTTPIAGKLVASKTLTNGECNLPSCTTKQWDLKLQWIKDNGTKYEWHTTVNQSYVAGHWVDNPDPEATEPLWMEAYWGPDENTFYDNLTLETQDSEFLRIETGAYFNIPAGATGTATLIFKDGTRFLFTKAVAAAAPHAITESWELRTLNGNRLQASDLTTSATTNSGTKLYDILPLKDTMGREITYAYASNTETITLKDANNQDQVYKINWGTVSVTDGYMPGTVFRVVQSVVLPNNKQYDFTYNTSGLLSKITLPGDGTRAYLQYTYARPDSKWAVASKSVFDGTTTNTWYYTPSGINGVQDPTGAREYHYLTGDCGSGSFCTGKDGRVEYRASDGTILKQVNTDWSESDNTRRQSVTTWMSGAASRVDYTYDSNNNVTQQDDVDLDGTANGTRLRRIVRTYLTSSTYTTKHILNRVTTEKVYTPGGDLDAETDYEYDNYTAEGSNPVHAALVSRSGTIPGWTSPGTNPRANVTGVKRWLNHPSVSWPSTWNQYDVLGNVVKTIDPLNHATTIDFSDNFCAGCSPLATGVVTFALPKSIMNALSQSTTTVYDFNTGLPKVTTNPRGLNTTTTYDGLNRVTSITEPNAKQTTYYYDNSSHYSGSNTDNHPVTTKEVTVSTGNTGHVETHFDKLYRVTKTRTDDPEGAIAVDTTYDSLGRAAKVSNPYRATAAASAWTYTAYDPIGRTICTSVSTQTSPCAAGGPADAKVQYTYTGNQTTTINEAGNQRRYTYNALGKMVKVEEPNPTLDTPLVTTYVYETSGVLHQSNQLGQIRTLNHDSLGRETSEVLPESGTTTYTYDDLGHMLTATDARGVKTTYTYDDLGRALTRSYCLITGGTCVPEGTPTVTFTYDQNSYTGERTTMADAIGTVAYSYDNMGRLTQESRTLTGVTGTFNTSYVYNIKGDLTQMTYPSGRVVAFNLKTAGGCCNSRLDSVTSTVSSTSSTIANELHYDASGALNARTLNPNGSIPLAETFAYNHRMQQTQVRAAESSTYVMDFSYGYGTTNNVGQLLSRTDAIQSEHSVNYAYDSIYRLSQVTSADASWGIAWTFDTWSNRHTQTAQGFVASNNIVGSGTLGYSTTGGVVNNRMTATNMTYDAAGNLTNEGTNGHTYTYNGKNQITAIDGSSTDNYFYDGEGRRAKKTIGTLSTFYFYGPGGIISEFSTTIGATAASTTDATCYQTSDRQGSAVLLIASNGLVIENNRTLPYGELWNIPVASKTTKKFTTYERDSESGLDYAVNRYMSNSYGRFQSPDKGGAKLFLPISLNRYIYVMADPVNRVDLDGNDTNNCHTDASGNVVCDGNPMPRSPNSGEGFSGVQGPLNPGCEDFAPGGCNGGDQGGGAPETPQQKLMRETLALVNAKLGRADCRAVFAGGIAKGHDPGDVLGKIVVTGRNNLPRRSQDNLR